ncbi:MAG: hypothetical protein Kow00121_14010 [Elainellaceae cyanobacterium]
MAAASNTSIKKLAIRGAAWTVFGYGASQILRFGNNVILTRLLVPELFGLMSLVNVLITGLHLFSDLGFNTNIVQSKRGDDPDFLDTAWTLQVVRSIVLWFGCLVVAYPASQIYEEPKLLWLIPIVGLNTLIGGFNTTAIYTLNRHLSVKYVALFELLGQVAAITVMLTWAWFSPTIWALVAGTIASALFQLGFSYYLKKWQPNRFKWERAAVREIFSFGKWIFVSTILTFLSTQADRLILGGLFTLELLGVYGVAFTLADIPRSLLGAISGKVIYPTYSKLIDLPRAEFRAKVLKNRLPIILVLSLGLALLVGCGDLLVSFLYDKRYSTDASWMLPILALGTWPLLLTQTVEPILFSVGKPRYVAFSSFLSFLFYGIGIPLAFYSPLREVGAVLAVACSNIPIWFTINFALHREKVSVIRQDILITLLFLGLLSLVMAIRNMLGLGLPLATLLS